MLNPQHSLPLHHELAIDLFAGGGGASTGIEQAIGRPVDIAINHDREAVAMHFANHPQTKHYVEDVFAVDPVAVVDGRPVGLLWASPDCKHFSKAKGGKPVSKKIRGLAWVVIKWAKLVRPRVIFLENVEEFQTWGPLGADNKPCKLRKGRTFARWKSSLEQLGYKVGYKEDRAHEFGTPTIRKRLYLIARCDGEPIVFPETTHAQADSLTVKAKKQKPFRTAAECIDWDDPAPSIFERKKPLADATNKRIAKGIRRYVIDAANPFIVPLTHQGGDRTEDINKPFMTITGANRGEKALIVPTLVQTGYGEREGQAPRALDIEQPLGTVVGTNKHALVSAFLTEHAQAANQRVLPVDEPLRTQMAEVKGGHYSMVAATLIGAGGPAYSGKPTAVDKPMGAQTTENHKAIATATLIKNYTGVVGSDLNDPIGTVTGIDHHSLVTANLVHYHADKSPKDVRASDLRDPIKTQTTENRHGLVTAHLTKFRSGSTGSAMDEPVHTLTAGGEAARPSTGNVMGMVTAALVGVGGRAGQSRPRGVDEPTATGTAKADAALVTATLVNTANSKTTGRGPNTWPVEDPLRTVTSAGGQALMTANLVHLGHGEEANGKKRWSHGIRDVEVPLNTVTASGMASGLVTSNLIKLRGTSKEGQSVEEPLHTISAQGTHHAEVRAFMIKYYGTDQDPSLQEPLHTVTTKDRFGLVTVKGQQYIIVDIGLRMLRRRELFRAQGFGDDYIISWGIDPFTGERISITNTASIRMCGNSVCPPMAKAYVLANYKERRPMLEAA